MAHLQSHRGNVIRLGARRPQAPPLQRGVRAYDILSPVLRRLKALAARSRQRRVLAGLVSAQRARQRRALARLSPRELTEIGLNRHDVETGLR